MRIGGVEGVTNLFTQAMNQAGSAGASGDSPLEGLGSPQPPLSESLSIDSAASPSGPGFGGMLSDALGEVNRLQGNADTLATKLAAGDVQDVHEVMLALSQASNAFGLTTQVRNKALEAYQEIMRMQV